MKGISFLKHVSFLNSLLAIIWLLSACSFPPIESETEKFEKDLNRFNNRMESIGQRMEILEAMEQELDEIETQLVRGEINREEYLIRSNEIKNAYGRKITIAGQAAIIQELPLWAKDIGLSEPAGMTLNQELSMLTNVNNPEEGFNSLLVVYTGNYQVAMKEAQRIAAQANIPISSDFKEALEISRQYGSSPLKGIAFANFEPFVKDAPVNISITVDEAGILTISAINIEQMNRQTSRNKTDQ
ncbi:MAG: hypothetical protein WCR58_02645 [Bacteroidales bacterium]|jgi:hypothetical protein|nr:hypothetical protein [Bacteroidales bacterium]MCK9447471.1 hypothetical protein [Bacteroidales bacterium]MDD3700655.1 hypothetical protein [Bacteroidales bacterium]MDY0368222.1 hypothetical protein [Bacteroidales bacterium]